MKYYIFMDSILVHLLSTVKEKLYLIQKKKQKKNNDLPNWWVEAQQTKNILRMTFFLPENQNNKQQHILWVLIRSALMMHY